MWFVCVFFCLAFLGEIGGKYILCIRFVRVKCLSIFDFGEFESVTAFFGYLYSSDLCVCARDFDMKLVEWMSIHYVMLMSLIRGDA